LKERLVIPELMDDPNLARDEHRRALDGVRRVNLFSNTASTIATTISSIAQSLRVDSPSILDLGCGSGDVAYGVAMRLSQDRAWHVEGWDMSAIAIEYAKELYCNPRTDKTLHVRAPRTSLAYNRMNVFDESTKTFDFVYCSLFLHHFDEQQAVRVLRKMHELARYAIIVDDLHRSWFGWWLAKIGVHLISRSPIVHFDGPQSVRAAFTDKEAMTIASKAGLQGVAVRRRWPVRWLMTAGRMALSQELNREPIAVAQEIPALACKRLEKPEITLPAQVKSIDNTGAALDAYSKNWEVAVIGAGVAGATAALLSAKRGFKTILVESKAFPREKVCGGCLNHRAQAALQRLGILDDVIAAGAVELNRLELRILKTVGNWSIPKLLSVRRSTLDKIIVDHATRAGVTLLSETQAKVSLDSTPELEPDRQQIVLRRGKENCLIHSKVVIVADGLTRSSLRDDAQFQSVVESDSRVGVQAFLEPSDTDSWLTPGTLKMCVAHGGYVGLSHTDGGIVDLAAAIDPKSFGDKHEIVKVIERLLYNTLGRTVTLPTEMVWRSTPQLTRSSKVVAGNRLLVIGDSIGYVEPFTGEGMSWAFASAEAVLPLIEEAVVQGWSTRLANEWTNWVCKDHFRKQTQCRWMARQLHRPRFAAWILQACEKIPPLRAYLIGKATL
jgi:menaquinone-9 beta-reductase